MVDATAGRPSGTLDLDDQRLRYDAYHGSTGLPPGSTSTGEPIQHEQAVQGGPQYTSTVQLTVLRYKIGWYTVPTKGSFSRGRGIGVSHTHPLYCAVDGAFSVLYIVFGCDASCYWGCGVLVELQESTNACQRPCSLLACHFMNRIVHKVHEQDFAVTRHKRVWSDSGQQSQHHARTHALTCILAQQYLTVTYQRHSGGCNIHFTRGHERYVALW
jgi:hypothetical protein